MTRLPAYSLFAAVINAAGLPIYIYAPKLYVDNYGVTLAALGTMLFALRMFDVIQDPVLGWISERLGKWRPLAVAFAGVVLAVSMIGLFAVEPPIAPLYWFGLTLLGLFSAFSFLTINFYAQGIAKVGDDPKGHVKLAAWRETGALLGICVAAVAPTLLMGYDFDAFTAFAWGFAAATVAAIIWMWPEWTSRVQTEPTPIKAIWSDSQARRLLLLALVNATPLAVSSTLFLFYVESALGGVGWEGALLVLFFLAAALSSPMWSKLASRYGEKPVLLSAMILAVISFGYTYTLGTGDVIPFAIVCVLSGATIGADLTLLPALFAKRMSVIAPNGGQGFGLWSLVSKFTLAFAAVVLLPLLEGAGFQSGNPSQPQEAVVTLVALYALVPSVLKLVAIALLVATKLED
ncbi:MFS transporter [Yoonia sp.]|uniref:MFS transporter n=1 Tax=Yoonia sp. TaxID=2212373 RepID=UPI0023983E87|nr:MFS transporter [Yoonia sp.]MDE0850827.1 MFS transporter [Yoonia sp.]